MPSNERENAIDQLPTDLKPIMSSPAIDVKKKGWLRTEWGKRKLHGSPRETHRVAKERPMHRYD